MIFAIGQHNGLVIMPSTLMSVIRVKIKKSLLRIGLSKKLLLMFLSTVPLPLNLTYSVTITHSLEVTHHSLVVLLKILQPNSLSISLVALQRRNEMLFVSEV